LLHAKRKNLVLINFYIAELIKRKRKIDDPDDLQDDAAANAVAVVAAIAAARILKVPYCLELCELNQQMTNAIVLEGHYKTTDFLMMSSKQMDAIVYLLGKTPANRGGVKILVMTALNAVAFGTWVKDVKRRGRAVGAILFTNKVLKVFKERLDRPDTDATAVVSPGAYKDSTSWGQYNLSVSNFLSTIKGVSDVPLSYVIRKDRVNSTPFSSDTEELVYSGEIFKADSVKAYQILKGLVLGTPAWAWIKELDRAAWARKSMTALRTHYDGPGMTRCCLESAKTIISGTKYLAEHTFSFEKYVTLLKAVFETLTECEEGMTANAQVYTLLKNIECTNSQVMAAVFAVRVSQTLQASFTNSANAISETVSLVFPDTQGKFKKQHVASVEKDEKGRGGGRGGGCGRVSQTLQSSFTDSANAISETVLLVFPDTQGCSRASPILLTRLAKLSCLCSRTRKASSRNGILLPSRRTERGAAEEVAEAGEAEAAGAVVVVEAAR
jgi:hypothetical protein